MNGASPGRHLSLDAFRQYLSSGVPMAHPVPGEPRVLVFIDPDGPSIGLPSDWRTSLSGTVTVAPPGWYRR